jgi:hypothetical protein
MRTEATLDALGVTESNWKEGVASDPNFAASESPGFVARGVVALACDPRVARKAGGLYSSWELAEEYGFTDVDGRRPNVKDQLGAGAGTAPSSPLVAWRVDRLPG